MTIKELKMLLKGTDENKELKIIDINGKEIPIVTFDDAVIGEVQITVDGVLAQ